MASRLSSSSLHSKNSGCQVLMKTPTTSKPCFFNNAALTAESTPPDKPTKTVFICFILYIHQLFVKLVGRPRVRKSAVRPLVLDAEALAHLSQGKMLNFRIIMKLGPGKRHRIQLAQPF